MSHPFPRGRVIDIGTRMRPHARTRTRARVCEAEPWIGRRVCDHSLMADRARCNALLQGNARCRSVVVEGSEFCAHHDRLVPEHGADTLKRGEHLPPRRSERRPRRDPAPLVVEEREVAVETGTADPASVRPRLAEAAAASLDEIQRALLDAALGAVREHWVTCTCGSCGQKQRLQVNVPDVRSRVAAIELLLREGLGRPPQAEEPAAPRLPTNVAAVKEMGWEEMQYVFASVFADELEAVAREGGRDAVRGRLERLSKDERRVLRDELAAMSA
jgi:hypothetical protein